MPPACGGKVVAQPPKGGERSEPVSRIVFRSYDTESKSRNVLASPLGEEGHEVAKGVQANWIHRGAPRPANPVRRHPAKSVCTRVRMIMILDVDVTAERRHYNTHRPPLMCSLCIASIGGPPIGGQDRDGASYRCSAPYTLSRFAGLPLKGKRENRWHWILCHI